MTGKVAVRVKDITCNSSYTLYVEQSVRGGVGIVLHPHCMVIVLEISRCIWCTAVCGLVWVRPLLGSGRSPA